MKYFKLSNGVEMPVLGLGTFTLHKWNALSAIKKAISLGYLGFDTAAAYGNEYDVGWGLYLSGKKRERLFITTKLSNRQQREGSVKKAIETSLKKLKLDYIDLYLMHWPVTDFYQESWKQMEEIYKKGLCRAIGVCNFHQHHLQSLFQVAEIKPMVNQVERHPLLSQKQLISFCKQNEIVVEAYSPLARMDKKLVEHSTLREIANKYQKTVVQVILRWNYQSGIVSIPKSKDKHRLKENINIFDFTLSDIEMQKIDSINENYRVRHDPDHCDFTKL